MRGSRVNSAPKALASLAWLSMATELRPASMAITLSRVTPARCASVSCLDIR